ncbi:MAG TPA: FAD:protein FMN transferase [Planctomycetota bacterium]
MPLRRALHAMGTRFELLLDDAPGARAAAEEALACIEDEDLRLSAFRRDSLVAHLNAHAGAACRVDDDFLALLALCLTVWEESDGAFDPALGGAMTALGFREAAPAGPGGGRHAPATAAAPPLTLDPAAGTATVSAGRALDLGAVGKGWALDRAAAALRAAGVERALLHGGTSSVLAIGAPPGAEAWTIAIRRPPAAPGPALEVELADAALGVSGGHGRVHTRYGETLTHVLDPATGAPARRAALAAVVAESAALADAWSTALLVRGGPCPRAPLTWAAVLPADASAGTAGAENPLS